LKEGKGRSLNKTTGINILMGGEVTIGMKDSSLGGKEGRSTKINYILNLKRLGREGVSGVAGGSEDIWHKVCQRKDLF